MAAISNKQELLANFRNMVEAEYASCVEQIKYFPDNASYKKAFKDIKNRLGDKRFVVAQNLKAKAAFYLARENVKIACKFYAMRKKKRSVAVDYRQEKAKLWELAGKYYISQTKEDEKLLLEQAELFGKIKKPEY